MNIVGEMFRNRKNGDVVRILSYDDQAERIECAVWSDLADGQEARTHMHPLALALDPWKRMNWFQRWRFTRCRTTSSNPA